MRTGDQPLDGDVANWSTKRRWVGEAFEAFERAGYTVASGYAVVKNPATIGTSTSICVRKVAGEPLRAVDIPRETAERFEVLPPVDRPRRAPISSPGP